MRDELDWSESARALWAAGRAQPAPRPPIRRRMRAEYPIWLPAAAALGALSMVWMAMHGRKPADEPLAMPELNPVAPWQTQLLVAEPTDEPSPRPDDEVPVRPTPATTPNRRAAPSPQERPDSPPPADRAAPRLVLAPDLERLRSHPVRPGPTDKPDSLGYVPRAMRDGAQIDWNQLSALTLPAAIAVAVKRRDPARLLAALDSTALGPKQWQLHLTRGQLRAATERCDEARRDFAWVAAAPQAKLRAAAERGWTACEARAE